MLDQKSVSRGMMNRTLEKTIIVNKDQLKKTPREQKKSQNGSQAKPTVILQ